jgi:tetratricopeptide (TPR) repeat protein
MNQTAETFAELAIPVNPFPGLRPFDFEESHLFFGRDGQSEQLISKLGRTHFLAVVGTSGSGKSSLVRAGLMPSLLGGFMSSAGSNWRIAIMRPGNDPVGNLARALNAPDVFGSDDKENAALQTVLAEASLQRGSRGLVDTIRQAIVAENENILVIVDQFEEIFRFARVAEDKEYRNEAAAFVKLLLEASRQRELPIYVVLTMRSDYLGDCSQFWGLPEAINESQYLIPRLTRDQLREAMTGPVNVARGQITPRLVARLLNDVGEDQDQLPVLQHLMMRVWDECKEKRLEVEVQKNGGDTVKLPHRQVHKGEALDICCYDAVGGMAHALSQHADEGFNELPDDRSRHVAEKLFKALTEKGTDNREIRRPVTLGEICAVVGASASEVITVIETFRVPSKSFLMPPAGVPLHSESLIDISHESLIRGWARLKQWVDEEARSARIYLRVAETAVLNSEGGAGFWRDPDLQIALTWREQSRPNEVWARRYHPQFPLAMSFLDRSVAARDAEVEKEETRRKKEIQRTRLTAFVFLVAFLLSMAAGAYALTQSRKARAAQKEAEFQALLAKGSSEEAERQKGIALKEKEGAIVARDEAERAKIEALAQKKKADASSEQAQKNLIEANRQKIAAQQASELGKAEALKGQGLTALKEGNEPLAIKYFTDLHTHYKTDRAGQAYALASLGDIYKERVPFALLTQEYTQDDFEDMNESGQGYAKMMKQYLQTYLLAARMQDKDEESLTAEIQRDSEEATKEYNQALDANKLAASELAASNQAARADLALRRGDILQNLGDLALIGLSDDLDGVGGSKKNPASQAGKEKALESSIGYYAQARIAYREAGKPLLEAEMLKKMGDILYQTVKEPSVAQPETSASQQSDQAKLQSRLDQAVTFYNEASAQFGRAGNPQREASVLLRIAALYNASNEDKENPDRQKAVGYLEHAREIYRKEKNFSKEGEVNESLAQMYDEMSDQDQQILALKQALEAYANEFTKKKRSDSESKVSQLLPKIGELLYDSDKEAANRFFAEVLSSRSDPISKANILGLIATFYKDKDDKEVLRYLTLKKEVYRQAGSSFEEGNTLFDIGSLYPEQSAERVKAYDEALSAYRRIGERAQDSTTNSTVIVNLKKIADSYVKSDKEKAFAIYEELLDVAKLSPYGSTYTVTSVVKDAGAILLGMKSSEGNARAQRLFQKALDAFTGRAGNDTPELWATIGDVYKGAGDKHQARASYDRATKIYLGSDDVGTYRHTDVLKKIAELETGGIKLSEFYLSEAEAARRAGDVTSQAIELQLAGIFYRDAKDEEQAMKYLEQARQLFNTIGLKKREATLLRVQANLYEKRNDKQKAGELRRLANQLNPGYESVP